MMAVDWLSAAEIRRAVYQSGRARPGGLFFATGKIPTWDEQHLKAFLSTILQDATVRRLVAKRVMNGSTAGLTRHEVMRGLLEMAEWKRAVEAVPAAEGQA